MQKYSVWQNAWKDGYDSPLEISLPDNWDAEYHSMPGDAWPRLTVEQLREKIRNPLNSESIRELAKEGKSAVILFDDLSRGTPCKEIAHIVLEELQEGGMEFLGVLDADTMGTVKETTERMYVIAKEQGKKRG